MAISKFLAERKLSLKFAHVYHAEIITSYAASLKKHEALWAVAKPIVPKPTGAPSSPQPPTSSSTPLPTEKTRISSIPSGPASASAGDTRRSSSSAATPSAPRAQLASTNGTSQTTSDRPNDTRLAMGRQVGICSLYSKLTRTSIAASPDRRLLKESDQTKAANHPDRMLKGLSKQN